MDPHEAVKILRQLADGIDPDTAERLPDGSTFNKPEVIRALFLAVEALQTSEAKGERRGHASARTGEPWSAEEDERLCSAFHDAVDFKEIAAQHGRSKGAIISRLTKLGKLRPREVGE